MSGLKESKKIYDDINIPSDYERRIDMAVKQGEENYKAGKKTIAKKHINWGRTAAITAAAAFCLLFTGLNTSRTFAGIMCDAPVIGNVMQVLTIRDYVTNETNDIVNTTITRPEIVIENSTNENVADKTKQVNDEIKKRVDEYIAQANQGIEEYKQAFLATGGTQKEWEERDIKLDVSYEVKSQNENVLSFVITCYESSYAYMSEQMFYNINLSDGSDITLKSMLGDNYNEIIKEQVVSQCEERRKLDENSCFWSTDEPSMLEENAYDDPDFYINEAGNAVVVYPKYTLAPGYMGILEFEIK